MLVMAANNREKPPSPASRGECQELKDLANQQDATMMLLAMASSNKASPEISSPAIMHPLLAAAACRGNCEELNFLLSREGPRRRQPMENLSEGFRNQVAAYFDRTTGRSEVMQQATTADVEEGIHAVPLLMGVTMEGDTALHLVAANGDDGNFIRCAVLIHSKDPGLLFKGNNQGDTPLHCASRAGKIEMVRCLIALAGGEEIVNQILRKGNKTMETALHEAIRIGDCQLVKELLGADPELACFPNEGTSPLYLAISLGRVNIAQALHDESKNNILSYSGPSGKNALHAAVLRGPVITEKVLQWNMNKGLTTQRDENGSTPLHFAAGLRGAQRKGSVCLQVFKANPAALYQPDKDGLSPIHVAAFVGAADAIAMFVKECPSSAGLRDSKGRTFLHVAVERKKMRVIHYACRNESLAWIWNMWDNDGNTALHLAVQAGSILAFYVLFRKQQVNLNVTNKKGETPLDIAEYNVAPAGMRWTMNPENLIRSILRIAGANNGVSRQDHRETSYDNIHPVKSNCETKQLEELKDTTQSSCVGSVLIATVSFGATFALPGGYRADDHPNGGTPTLAGRYDFDAFMMANTLAFISSSMATFGFIYSGSPLIHLGSRKVFLQASIYLVCVSIRALSAAFALGAYLVLAPVAHKTAIGICFLSAFVPLSNNMEIWGKTALLAPGLYVRKGILWTLRVLTTNMVLDLVIQNWPLIFIFYWPLYSTNQSIPDAVQSAQPTAQLH